MSESFCRVGDVELCYESIGDPRDPTVLLIIGLGLSLVFWRDDFCAELAGHGLRVVRFDNRDVGRSTQMCGPGITIWQFVRRRARPVYTLADMADDAAGLIGSVAPTGAHVVGVSLGASIAQELVVRHPDRTRSLVSIMGRPGDGTGRVALRMIPEFLRPAPTQVDGKIEGMVRSFRRIGSVGRTAVDDEDVRVTMRRAVSRDRSGGAGSGRQLAAIVAERDRTQDLRALRVPTLVIHGDRDRVIQLSGGRSTAAAIPGAELLVVEGMGHDLARRMWPTVIDGIVRTVARA